MLDRSVQLVEVVFDRMEAEDDKAATFTFGGKIVTISKEYITWPACPFVNWIYIPRWVADEHGLGISESTGL